MAEGRGRRRRGKGGKYNKGVNIIITLSKEATFHHEEIFLNTYIGGDLLTCHPSCRSLLRLRKRPVGLC